MEKEKKIEEILNTEGFVKQEGVAGIQPSVDHKSRYFPLGNFINNYIMQGEEELILKLTKVKSPKSNGCEFYLCELYKKEE